jgi:hypothetical protein
MSLSPLKTGYTIAKVVSLITFPLLIPFYTYVVLITHFSHIVLQIPHELRWKLAWLILLTSFVLPSLIMVLMYRLKFISSLAMEKRAERPGPILVTALFFYLTYYLLRQINVAPIFYYYMLGATALSMVCLGINFVFKISLHMVGWGGLTGMLIGLSYLMQVSLLPLISIAILLSGVTAWARLRLSAHSDGEVYTGFLTGTLFMLLLFYLLF